jgi:hypothetical protein
LYSQNLFTIATAKRRRQYAILRRPGFCGAGIKNVKFPVAGDAKTRELLRSSCGLLHRGPFFSFSKPAARLTMANKTGKRRRKGKNTSWAVAFLKPLTQSREGAGGLIRLSPQVTVLDSEVFVISNRNNEM